MRRALCLLVAAGVAAQAEPPRMSWLDNGVIRVGIDLELGGAITWLSRSGDASNLINSYDWGRQVQMSFYSGPVPFSSGAKQPRHDWVGLGWNPIQSGDTFGHRSQVLEPRNDGARLYVKCIPMQWPLEDVPGECTLESWLELDGAAVRARGRLLNNRTDHTQYPARLQELPAVYTNAPWHHLYTYSGARPFTGEPPVELAAKPPPTWSRWLATENWSALVDDAGWGLGVWNPGAFEFGGGLNGRGGPGGTTDTDCGYLAPNRIETLDHDIDYRFRYELILGSLEQIRTRVQASSAQKPATAWDFTKGRAGWHCEHATDSGWRPAEALAMTWSVADPQFISPVFCARTEVAGTLVLEAAFTTPETSGRVYWRTVEAPGFAEARALPIPIQGDGVMRIYTVKLSESPSYRGALVQLRLDPGELPNGHLSVRSIRLER